MNTDRPKSSSEMVGKISGIRLPTNSFHVIRNPIAVLIVAPFSPDRDITYSTRHPPAKGQWGSIIPRAGARFESLEPTSAEVECLGHIKFWRKWTKPSKNNAERKPRRTTKGNLLSPIMKFIFCSHGGRARRLWGGQLW